MKKKFLLPDEKSGCFEWFVEEPSEGDEDKLPRRLEVFVGIR